MALTAHVYGKILASLLTKQVDPVADSMKVMLCTSGYTPDQGTHQFKSDVTSEVTGTGYTAGGATLTGKSIIYDTSTHVEAFTCDSPSFVASTITARYAVFYFDTGSAATSRLLGYWDFGADVSTTSAAFTLTISSSGLVTLTAA